MAFLVWLIDDQITTTHRLPARLKEFLVELFEHFRVHYCLGPRGLAHAENVLQHYIQTHKVLSSAGRQGACPIAYLLRLIQAKFPFHLISLMYV